MAFIVLGIVALALIGALIYVLGAPDKHAQMTEEEFEAEAKRGSMLGAAFMGVEKVLRPKQIEHVLVQKERVEKGAAIAGDPPVPGAHPDSNTDEKD
jgi:hypothetical protein